MSQKKALSFVEITSALRSLPLPQVDVVVGIGRGGIVPASLVASKLGCELHIVRVNYRDDDNKPVRPTPTFLEDVSFSLPANTRILLVDDVSVTGKTLTAVQERLDGFNVQTFVMKGKGDYVLFPDIKTCVQWPWHEKPVQLV